MRQNRWMPQIVSIFPVLMLLCMCIAVLIVQDGCTGKVKQSVKLVVRTGLESEGLRVVAKDFTKQTGIEVEISELGREGYMSAVPTQILTGSASFDVAFLPSTIIAELGKAGGLAELNQLMAVGDPDLIAAYGYGGKTYAIPCDISTMFLFYRKDLIAKPPETWDEYLEIARKFSKGTNPKSPTDFGCAVPGASGEDLPKAFYCLLWSFGGSIMDGDSVTLNSAGSIAAAQFYKKLVDSKVMAKDITSWGFSQVYENLLNGKLAMAAPFWNATATLLLTSDSPYRDKIGYTWVPGVKQSDGKIKRVSFQHAWTLAINAHSKVIPSAAKFIEFVTGPTGGRLYAKSVSGNPARYSILKDSTLQAVRPDFKTLVMSLEIAKSEPAVPFYAGLHNAMNECLTQILVGSKEPASAILEADGKIRGLARQ